jgi:hypothetical protein
MRVRVSQPIPFPGSDADRAANRASHAFTGGDDDRCLDCDVKPWHLSASYPCGTDVPRESFFIDA